MIAAAGAGVIFRQMPLRVKKALFLIQVETPYEFYDLWKCNTVIFHVLVLIFHFQT